MKVSNAAYECSLEPPSQTPHATLTPQSPVLIHPGRALPGVLSSPSYF